LGFGTASPTITDVTSSRYGGTFFQPNDTYNVMVYISYHTTGVNSGVAIYLSSTNSGGLIILQEVPVPTQSYNTINFLVPRGYWYKVVGAGNPNIVIDKYVEETL
jgi:hypothetical protein